MRYLQIVGTAIAVLLAVIAVQLHRLQPFTAADYERAAQLTWADKEAGERALKKIPMVQINN
jgi:hypothetical protein